MTKETKKSIPPYATPKSFNNLIKDLRENGIPDHITNDVLKGSNSAKAMMAATLKSLMLMDIDRRPTNRFVQLIEVQDNYSENMNAIVRESYPFLFDGSINLANTTTAKVVEKFKDAGAGGSTVSKCIAFFLSAAKDAGIEVSSRVKAPTPVSSNKPRPDPGSRDKGKGEQSKKDHIPKGMRKFEIPLRDIDDGILYLPEAITDKDAGKALGWIKFTLNQYYDFEEEK